MLEFHKIALEEVFPHQNIHDSGDNAEGTFDLSSRASGTRGASGTGILMIMSKGLGMEKVIHSLITIYAHASSLVLILNNNQFESLGMMEQLKQARDRNLDPDLIIDPEYFHEIDADVNAKERAELYKKGGVIAVSSRILVVDMLNHVIPISLVAGILVNHAHKVTDTSPITFILRLYRQKNKKGFIRAFSDQPDYFCNDISKLSRMMKALQCRTLTLWPRFQMNVRKNVEEKGSIELIELRIPFTKKMKNIQGGLIECLNQMLLELKRLHPSLDKDELKLEKSFSKHFDLVLRTLLDGIWQNASSKTKGIVSDLKTVRLLLEYLAQYDAVSFYAYLETERETVASDTKSAFKNTSFTWLHLDAANIAFSEGRKRVYLKSPDIPQTDPNIPKGYQVCVEEQPKWRALIQVLGEMDKERREKFEERGSVLVMCRGGKTCEQLRQIIAKSDFTKPTSPSSKFTSPGTKAILMDQMYEYFQWKGGMMNLSKALTQTAAASTLAPGSRSTSSAPPASKRRRARPGAAEGNVAQQTFLDEAKNISESITARPALWEPRNSSSTRPAGTRNHTYITVRTYTGFSHQETPDSTILDYLTPQWIVIYDPDVSFVRRIEVYKAENPDRELKVFFLVYDNSSEEQQYLTNLRREKEAFEKLIHQKSHLVIPIDENGQVIIDSEEMFWKDGQGPVINKKILVDVREFRSSLPLLIHSRRIDIIPITIEVGDYILSPSISVERKSPSDLAQSLKSGRLYKQAQAMTLHYSSPVLLIEYPQANSFQLNFTMHENELDTCKRLCLLLIHFPKMFLIWSSCPAATAEVFEDLQREQPDPDLEKARECGVESGTKLDKSTNQTPCDILLTIPGISFRNYHHVMNKVKNLKAFTKLSEVECIALIGPENGRMLYHYIHDDCAVV